MKFQDLFHEQRMEANVIVWMKQEAMKIRARELATPTHLFHERRMEANVIVLL